MDNLSYLDQFAARKERATIRQLLDALPDTFLAWIECYLDLTVIGVRPEDVAKKSRCTSRASLPFSLNATGMNTSRTV